MTDHTKLVSIGDKFGMLKKRKKEDRMKQIERELERLKREVQE